jgi:hypothetical protein
VLSVTFECLSSSVPPTQAEVLVRVYSLRTAEEAAGLYCFRWFSQRNASEDGHHHARLNQLPILQLGADPDRFSCYLKLFSDASPQQAWMSVAPLPSHQFGAFTVLELQGEEVKASKKDK